MKVPVIDAHVHLRSHTGIPAVVDIADRAGCKRINIVCVPGTPERSLNSNSAALLAKALNPQRFYVFGGLTYNIDEMASIEKRYRELL